MSSSSAPTPRTRVVREPQRAVYDRGMLNRILDEGFICHVGFVVDGQPFVIPTSYGRHEDALYIHGSAASRMLRNVSGGIPVCVTVTLLDGRITDGGGRVGSSSDSTSSSRSPSRRTTRRTTTVPATI